MHFLMLVCLMLVIFTCSMAVIAKFATRPLRTSFSGQLPADSHHQFPFSRLLDPVDYSFLRRRGFSPARVRKIRACRRNVARLWLRTLAADFNRIDHALMTVMVRAEVDRPDLAILRARQQAVFCCYFLQVEFQLALDACGFWSLRPLASLEVLETACARMQEFAVSMQPACSEA
jgi:hypothetical protein